MFKEVMETEANFMIMINRNYCIMTATCIYHEWKIFKIFNCPMFTFIVTDMPIMCIYK